MKERIATTVLAVLELKRQRAAKANAELDSLHEQILELLAIAPDEKARGIGAFDAADYVTDFLGGDRDPRDLCQLLGIEVAP
jgi:hypothetical protein